MPLFPHDQPCGSFRFSISHGIRVKGFLPGAGARTDSRQRGLPPRSRCRRGPLRWPGPGPAPGRFRQDPGSGLYPAGRRAQRSAPQLRWDSGFLIGHGDGRIRTVRLCMDLDFPAFRPVLYRVFHQIEQCPAEQFSAALDGTGGSLCRNVHPLAAEQ